MRTTHDSAGRHSPTMGSLTATLELDLRREAQPLRAAATALTTAPDGCRVALRVAAGQLPDVAAYQLVLEHRARLGELDIRCPAADTIRLWHAVLTGANPWEAS